MGSPGIQTANRGDTIYCRLNGKRLYCAVIQTPADVRSRVCFCPPLTALASRSLSLKEMSKSRTSVHHATCMLYLNHFWVNWGLTCRESKKKKRRGITNTQGLWGLGDRGVECRIGQGG